MFLFIYFITDSHFIFQWFDPCAKNKAHAWDSAEYCGTSEN